MTPGPLAGDAPTISALLGQIRARSHGRSQVVPISLALILLQGCGNGGDGIKREGQASGSQAATVAGDPCGIIAPAEVAALFGAPLTEKPAESLPQSRSCEFAEAGGNVAVIVTEAPGRYYEEHRGKDFRELPAIGDGASIVWELDGWRATAKAGEQAVVVMTDGPRATQENTIAIMTAALPKS